MSDEIRVKGTWWSPERPDYKLSGELKYSATAGAELDLFGYFFENLNDSARRRLFTVFGVTVRGKHVTLFNCHTRNLTTHLCGGKSAYISSCYGVVGGHFATPSEMKFCRITARFTDLAEWAAKTGIGIQHDPPSNTTTFTLRVPDDVSLGEKDGVRMKLAFICSATHGFHSCELSEDCMLVLETEHDAPYEQFGDLLGKLQHFISLGVGRPVYRIETIGRVDQTKYAVQDTPVFEEFEFIRKLSVLAGTEEKLLPMEMPFSLQALQPDPADTVRTYLEKHAKLVPVCELYFTTLYNEDMPLRQKFLSLAHAIEAYHRAFIGGKYLADEEYERNVKPALLQAIPSFLHPDFNESLRNKLKYLHEFSLRKQLQDVCGRFEDLLRNLCGESIAFGIRVAETRNRLTHADANAPCDLDWKELWLLSEQVALVLSVCLLHELGFPEEKIRATLNNNRHARAIFLNR